MEPVITVTAGREQELSSAADALTVLDDRRIKALNLPQVSDLLRLMPGVSVNVQGPQGSLTQIRIRGAEANHTLTFVDGIEINDPASGNETRFETLSADTAARVELLRGAQSALWGADRKSVVEGKRVSVGVDLGGVRTIQQKKEKKIIK